MQLESCAIELPYRRMGGVAPAIMDNAWAHAVLGAGRLDGSDHATSEAILRLDLENAGEFMHGGIGGDRRSPEVAPSGWTGIDRTYERVAG